MLCAIEADTLPWLTAVAGNKAANYYERNNSFIVIAFHAVAQTNFIKSGPVLKPALFSSRGKTWLKEIEAWASIRGNTILHVTHAPLCMHSFAHYFENWSG